MMAAVFGAQAQASCLRDYDRAIALEDRIAKMDKEDLHKYARLITGDLSGTAGVRGDSGSVQAFYLYALFSLVPPVGYTVVGLGALWHLMPTDQRVNELKEIRNTIWASQNLVNAVDAKDLNRIERNYERIEKAISHTRSYYGIEITKSDFAATVVELDNMGYFCPRNGQLADGDDLVFMANQVQQEKKRGRWDETKARIQKQLDSVPQARHAAWEQELINEITDRR